MGSGKTAVAFLALMAAVGGGHQGALMAPTEVLATQHAASLTAFLERLPAELPGGRRPTCALITGGVSLGKAPCCRTRSLHPHCIQRCSWRRRQCSDNQADIR